VRQNAKSRPATSKWKAIARALECRKFASRLFDASICHPYKSLNSPELRTTATLDTRRDYLPVSRRRFASSSTCTPAHSGRKNIDTAVIDNVNNDSSRRTPTRINGTKYAPQAE
jgi:hypothetical protein